jgi:hypothetical protein
MAIKAGQIIHDAYGFVIDRIQTGGVNNLNIPEEKINELGNFNTVATIRDIPDLSFDLESFDVSAELEALLTFSDPAAAVNGDGYDLADSIPLDIISPIKDGWNIYTASRGVIVPYLTLESSSYKFDVRNNSTQQHTLRGDSYFYVDGAPYYQEFNGDGVTGTFNLAHTAIPYLYSGATRYVLECCVVYSDGTYRRLFLGEHYTNTPTSFTVLDPAANAPIGSTVKVSYGSATAAQYPQTVHQGVSVKPAALKGKDIDVYVGDTAATPTFTRWTSVQSCNVDWKVTLDKDEEFGNSQYVAQDHDVPEVTGSITIKPRDLDDLYDKVYQVANVDSGEVAGPLTSVGVPLEIRLSDPDTGVRLKTFYVQDARFKIPGIQGRVQQKTTVQFDFSSDGGNLRIYKGNRYGT